MRHSDRLLWLCSFTFVIIILVVITIGRWLNYKVLFQPTSKHIWKPNEYGYQDMYLKQDDDSGIYYVKEEKKKHHQYINIWYFEPFEHAKVVLYCHGNNDNNSHRDYVVEICNKFKLNLLLVDYRGYGKSDGRPTAEGVISDAKSAYAFLRKNYEASDIVIWGESLGGAAAIRLAAERPCARLVLLATFASLPDIVGNMKVNGVIRNSLRSMTWLLWDKINSKHWISKVKCPVAIVHSVDDELIPYQNAKILYSKIKHKNKTLISVHGDHAEPTFQKTDLAKVLKFIHADEHLEDLNDMELTEALDVIHRPYH